jgi:hypothetical protein
MRTFTRLSGLAASMLVAIAGAAIAMQPLRPAQDLKRQVVQQETARPAQATRVRGGLPAGRRAGI